MRPMRCSSTAGFHGSSRLMQALAARCRFRPTPPASLRNMHADARVVVEVDDALRALRRSLGAGEEDRAHARVAEQVAQAPLREAQHAPPLAEHHDLAPLREDEVGDQAPELDRAWAQKSPSSSAASGRAFAYAGQISSKRSCPSPFAMMRCCVRSCISRRNSACVSGRWRPRPQELRDRLVQLVVLLELRSASSRRGRACRCAAGAAASTSCRTRRTTHGASRSRSVSRFRAPAFPVARRPLTRVCHGDEAPLRRERDVVDPVEDRGQLLEPVLHRRAR